MPPPASPTPESSADLARALGRLAEEQAGPAFFVGGCVRDALRGEPSKDVDLAVAGSPWEVGKAIRRAFGGHLFWLREADQVARVLLPEAGGLQVDLNPLLGGGLEADLRARDLTINAMAVPAPDGLAAPLERLVDPTGGVADLRAGLIRFAARDAPRRDPLRTLRAFRFRWKLGFEFAPGAVDLARECVPLLARVSGERIRDELFQLLAVPDAARPLEEVLAAGAGPFLVGRAADFGRCAAAVGEVEARLTNPSPDLAAVLAQEPTAGRRRREVLLWAAALGAMAPVPAGEAAAKALALSSDERTLMAKGLAHAPAAEALLGRWPVSGRERFVFCREAGAAAPEAVLLAPGPDGPRADLLAEALHRHLRPEAPLVTGSDLMEGLGIRPGPALGRILREIEEARADGAVTTREAALALARRLIR